MDRIPNSEQQAVISNLDDNIILYASAGTGKTFTVANRIRNIIGTEQGEEKADNNLLCP